MLDTSGVTYGQSGMKEARVMAQIGYLAKAYIWQSYQNREVNPEHTRNFL